MPNLADSLVEDLLKAGFDQVANIRDALGRSSDTQLDRLWAVFRQSDGNPEPTVEERFRAGLTLVGLDTNNEEWKPSDDNFLAEQLLATNPVFQPVLWDLLRPRRKSLAEPIEAAFRDSDRSDPEKLGAANALVDLASDDIPRLANLMTVATPEQFAVLYPLVAASPSPSTVEELANTAATLPPDELGSVERIGYGQQRANAAVTLVRLGEREKALPVFNYTDDPEALTQFIFRCRERGVGVEPLLELLDIESRRASEGPALEISSEAFRDSSRARYALLLALGEFTLQGIPELRRDHSPETIRELVRERSQFGRPRCSRLVAAAVGTDRGGHPRRPDASTVFGRP